MPTIALVPTVIFSPAQEIDCGFLQGGSGPYQDPNNQVAKQSGRGCASR